jgi:hypothetical protein
MADLKRSINALVELPRSRQSLKPARDTVPIAEARGQGVKTINSRGIASGGIAYPLKEKGPATDAVVKQSISSDGSLIIEYWSAIIFVDDDGIERRVEYL